jgi:hypothetical protein
MELATRVHRRQCGNIASVAAQKPVEADVRGKRHVVALVPAAAPEVAVAQMKAGAECDCSVWPQRASFAGGFVFFWAGPTALGSIARLL